MTQPLSYYCDTPHTQQLVGMFGDRLQNLDRSDFLDVITVFSAASNNDDEENHSEYTFQQYVSDTNLVVSVHIDAILEIMDGFERENELSLLLGLAAMLADRSAGQ